MLKPGRWLGGALMTIADTDWQMVTDTAADVISVDTGAPPGIYKMRVSLWYVIVFVTPPCLPYNTLSIAR